MNQLDKIVDGYLEAAAFFDGPENGAGRFPKSEIKKAAAICAEFVNACGPLAQQAVNLYGARSFGIDLWLTAAGHGAGFWDRSELEKGAAANIEFVDRYGAKYSADLGANLGEMLTAAAYGTHAHIAKFAYKSVYPAAGGWLYIE